MVRVHAINIVPSDVFYGSYSDNTTTISWNDVHEANSWHKLQGI